MTMVDDTAAAGTAAQVGEAADGEVREIDHEQLVRRGPAPQRTGGAVAYTDGGYVAAFVLTAVTAVLGVLAALALPRSIEQVELDGGTAVVPERRDAAAASRAPA